MGKFFGILLILLFVQPSWASRSTLFCASTASPTTLLITLDFPDSSDSCDIAYNFDCGRVLGRYTLTADLSDLHSPIRSEDNRDRVIDTFDEANQADLVIQEDDAFTIEFENGFRNSLTTPQGSMVTITSHMVTVEPATVRLYCHQQ